MKYCFLWGQLFVLSTFLKVTEAFSDQSVAFAGGRPISRAARPVLELYAGPDPNENSSKLTPAQRALQKTVRTKFSKTLVVDGYSDLTKRKTPTEKLTRALQDPRPVESRPSLNILESVKGAVDAASSIGKERKQPPTPPAGTPRVAKAEVQPKPPSEPPTKLPAKPLLSQEVIDSIPGLKSSNPFERLAALSQLKTLEVQEAARRKQQEIEEGIENTKKNINKTAENIKQTADNIAAIPGKVVKKGEETVEYINSIPGSVKKKADEIAAIPGKVEQKANEIVQSVEQTVDKTIKTVEEIKSIPSKVQQSVENTKKTIDRTTKAVEEVQYTTKVILGIEKPKPKPPKKAPPKPPNPATKVVGTVASTAGKAFLWAGKSAVNLTAKVAEKGVESIKESAAKQKTASPSKPTGKVGVPPKEEERPAPPKPDATKTKLKVEEQKPRKKEVVIKKELTDTDELERQVAEALKLAEEALKEKPNTEDNNRPQVEVKESVVTQKSIEKEEAKSLKVENEQGKAEDAKAEDAKAEDAKAEDAKAEDAKAEDAKVKDAKAEHLKAEEKKTKTATPKAEETSSKKKGKKSKKGSKN